MIIWNFISIVMSLVFETVYFPKWDLRLNVASSFGETTPFHLHVLGIFKKNQVLWLFLNGSLSPHPARSLRGFFSDTYCGNQVERLEENLIILWGSSWLGSPWVFDHIEPSAACQLQFTFSFLALAVSLISDQATKSPQVTQHWPPPTHLPKNIIMGVTWWHSG